MILLMSDWDNTILTFNAPSKLCQSLGPQKFGTALWKNMFMTTFIARGPLEMIGVRVLDNWDWSRGGMVGAIPDHMAGEFVM